MLNEKEELFYKKESYVKSLKPPKILLITYPSVILLNSLSMILNIISGNYFVSACNFVTAVVSFSLFRSLVLPWKKQTKELEEELKNLNKELEEEKEYKKVLNSINNLSSLKER